MGLMATIWMMLGFVIVFLISAIPLYLAVLFLGGKTTLVKTAFISFLAGLVVFAVKLVFSWGALIAFIILIWIYRESFKLKWWKAFVAWVLQFVILYALILIAALFGFTLAML